MKVSSKEQKTMTFSNHTALSYSQAIDLYNSEQEFPVNLHDASIWIGRRVDNLKKTLFDCEGLVQNVDYTAPEIQDRNSQGHGGRVDVYLTVECFKHLAMMSNTEQGYEVRNYFLDCEKKAKLDARALQDMKEGAFEIQMLVGRQRQAITSLMCSNNAAMTAGQLYSNLFPHDPELSIGEKRTLSKFLGVNAMIPANAKHFNVHKVDYSIVSDFREMRMKPVLCSEESQQQLSS